MNSILLALLIFYVIMHLAMSIVGFMIWRSADRKMTFLSDENEPWWSKLLTFYDLVLIPHFAFVAAMPIAVEMLAHYRTVIDIYKETYRTTMSELLKSWMRDGGVDFVMGGGIDQHPDAKTRKTYN